MVDTKALWKDVCEAFPFLARGNFDGYISLLPQEKFINISNQLHKNELYFFVEDLILGKIVDYIHRTVVPSFWSHFSDKSDLIDGFESFRDAVYELDRHYEIILPVVIQIKVMRKCLITPRVLYGETCIENVFKLLLRTALHAKIVPPNELQMIEKFYKVSFKAFYNLDKSFKEFNESGEDTVQCSGCSSYEVEMCRCNSIIEEFHETNKILIKLELLERLAGDIVTNLIHKQVESHVQDTCKGSFDTSYIDSLLNWLNTVVVGWLSRLYECVVNDEKVTKTLEMFKRKLQHLLYETYTKTRIEQLFTIIIEYPDSDPAIVDLKICLEKTDLRGYLTEKLQQTLESRLLHPGVNTPDIITAFSSSIRALRQLDPTGVLLETVTKPIRQYLRCRDDTVRCAVLSLTEEGPGELAEELVRDDTQNEIDNWKTWEPDPIDAPTPSKNSWDIITMLVNVYGSKDMFVNEYKSLLADRLLSQASYYNTEKEIRYLELLKRRFGDSQLSSCDVMLKDVYDSTRISSHLFSDPNFGLSQQPISCTAMILSGNFWPNFKDETLELPEVIKELFNTFTKAFEMFKGNRTLMWKPHLGSVNLEIEIKGRTINLTVNPYQAAIIWYFQEKEQWTIDELSAKLHVTPTALRRKIAFWQSQGLLRETSPDTFLLVEDNVGRSSRVVASSDMCDDDEAESAMASAQDQREEELQVFWSYIVGMLTNLDSLPLERIHQMLKMFASQGPTSIECTLPQLKHFLDRKVREHKLIFTEGLYKLQK